MWPVENTDHGQVEQAALLQIQSGPSPDFAPAIFGDQLLQRGIEFIGLRKSAIHVLLAQNGLADLQALLIEIIRHVGSPGSEAKGTIDTAREDPPFGWRSPATTPPRLPLGSRAHNRRTGGVCVGIFRRSH